MSLPNVVLGQLVIIDVDNIDQIAGIVINFDETGKVQCLVREITSDFDSIIVDCTLADLLPASGNPDDVNAPPSSIWQIVAGYRDSVMRQLRTGPGAFDLESLMKMIEADLADFDKNPTKH